MDAGSLWDERERSSCRCPGWPESGVSSAAQSEAQPLLEGAQGWQIRGSVPLIGDRP
jgi:hypothetical protein